MPDGEPRTPTSVRAPEVWMCDDTLLTTRVESCPFTTHPQLGNVHRRLENNAITAIEEGAFEGLGKLKDL